MTEDETYNGWKNYPTWCVNLWLSNDEGLYRATLARTEEIVGWKHDESTQVTSGIWTVEESRRFSVADMLKSWVSDDLAPDLGASFPADLLGWALELVDWHEIADAWLEQVTEQVDSDDRVDATDAERDSGTYLL